MTSSSGDEASSSFTKIFNPSTQYTKESIETFETTFGKHYMSAGGPEMTQIMYNALKDSITTAITNSSTSSSSIDVLDIGFGIGGAAFDFYEKLTNQVQEATTSTSSSNNIQITIHGIDLGEQGYELAMKELQRRNDENKLVGKSPFNITFQLIDATQVEFPSQTFNIIYSRDTLVHLNSTLKTKVFQNCWKWLKVNGQICIADYCLGTNSNTTGKPTPKFEEYLKARSYHMYTVSDYGKALEQVGFENVTSTDMAYWYCTTCQTELDRVLEPGPNRDKCIHDHGGLEQVTKLEQTYQNKIQMTLRGDRSYVLVVATKTERIEHLSLRQTVVDAYLKMYNNGHVMSCDGNISTRIPTETDNFMVTPTGVTVDVMEAKQIVQCFVQTGKAITGSTYKPTSEVDLHTLIYQSRPDVGAIVHSHSIYACAIACCRISLPPAHYAVCELLCCDPTKLKNNTGTSTSPAASAGVQCSAYHTYGTWELATSCLAALGENYACFLANHGAVVVGKDLEEAMYLTERLERECEIYWRAMQLGGSGVAARPIPLTPEEIHSLAVRDETYGQDATTEEATKTTDN